MQEKMLKFKSTQTNEICYGFRLIKSEYVSSKNGTLYTLCHEKTKAELLYFDREDENKTFSIAFKTLPENNTGVFHILEHSVLNGSEKYPVKEPFVSMLQSSMQTFLNAMTYSDKTVFPISSRNDKDFFNLMSVYLDAVFSPMIYKRPEIFMQEGWHYEFDENGEMFFNGVVFSEMKGVYSDVDSVIEDETQRLLFPDNSYGYSSGGHPNYITDLTYEKFVETHRRFYHPSNSKIFLDGHMDIDSVLSYIDEEYLSKYDYRESDFDFVMQEPKTAENTVYYTAREGEEELAHMSVSKILCTHKDVEKIYASSILAEYLTGSNEAPLKRAFLESGLAQDVNLSINDGVYQPSVSLVVNNIRKNSLPEIKDFLPEKVREILNAGLDKEALMASVEKFAFSNKEIREPYGVELCIRALDGWLYGDDPLTYIDNDSIFKSLREKVETDYFSNLLSEMLSDPNDKSYLYVLPSLTKDEDDAKREEEKLERISSCWNEDKKKQIFDDFVAMQQWQQSMDSDEDIATLPHLELSDVPTETKLTKTEKTTICDTQVLKVSTDTNGIVYLNMYFDISDFSLHELRMLSVLTSCFGELRTEKYSAIKMQTKIKANFGDLFAKIELISKTGDLKNCKPYLLVSAAVLEEKASIAIELLEELLLNGKYDETDRIYETVLQRDYMLKQSLISDGHMIAIIKSLSAFSAKGALRESLEGESFTNWFSSFSKSFKNSEKNIGDEISNLASKVFSKNRLFIGYSGNLDAEAIESLINALPENNVGVQAEYPEFDSGSDAVEIPASVSFSAIGHNIYALGGEVCGACSVLASLMSFAYLWGEVRVQGGAYGTGMNIRSDGDMFCYSYRDPDSKNSMEAYCGMVDFLNEFLSQEMPLDDIIIGTVNAVDPLLDPSGVCSTECTEYLGGVTKESILQRRREILDTTNEDLRKLIKLLESYISGGKFCVVGDKTSTAFINEK